MVPVLCGLFHEPSEDQLEDQAYERAKAVPVRLRNFQIEAHRPFAIDEIPDLEIAAEIVF
jgi:hypothetical protein